MVPIHGSSDPQRYVRRTDSLNPGKTQAKLTEEAADLLVSLTEDLRKWNSVSENPIPDQRIAKFVMRMIFCFFACDVGLLPKDAFSDLISVNRANPQAFRKYLSELFIAMSQGGSFSCAKFHISTAVCSTTHSCPV